MTQIVRPIPTAAQFVQPAQDLSAQTNPMDLMQPEPRHYG
jgi:hypothetical protein